MKKGIIVYKGKYGSTEQYAHWLKEELNIPIIQPGGEIIQDIDSTDYVVLGSSVYAGRLQLLKWIKDNVMLIRDKPVFLFVVCGTPISKIQELEHYIRSTLPRNLKDPYQIYFLPGRLVYKKLSWIDKLALRIGVMLTKDVESKKTMTTDYDGVKKECLKDLLNDIREQY